MTSEIAVDSAHPAFEATLPRSARKAQINPTGEETLKPNQDPEAEPKHIWIDLENSPHVPFFKPVIDALEHRGFRVTVTARDCFQVCDLAELFGLNYRRVGRHFGKNTLAKFAGLGTRMLQMTPGVLRDRPDLAVSHGSRSMFLLASLLRIPTLTIVDYEHVSWINWFRDCWILAPEIIPEQAVRGLGVAKDHILRYPGIKEDVYVPSFRPDSSLRELLGIAAQEVVVTLRPPASEAHYHNPESDFLLDAVFALLDVTANVKAVLLPRTPKQHLQLRQKWPRLFERGKVIVPAHAVDGLDLIWLSDLVVSGGGTMNREAAALGVPVYSIFRGKLGSVDQYLSQTGRLALIGSGDEVRRRIRLVHRRRGLAPDLTARAALQTVVDSIVMLSKCGRMRELKRAAVLGH